MIFAKPFRTFLPIIVFTSMLLGATAAYAQPKFTDTLEVELKQYTLFKKDTNGGCNVYVYTIGTHPDPVGNGKDNNYQYFGVYRGKPKKYYYSANVPAWIGIDDSPGNLISYTESASWTLSGSQCNTGIIGSSAQGLPYDFQYAYYSTVGGPVAIYKWHRVKGLEVAFDASRSYVATSQGHKPPSSYDWSFGDGKTGSGVEPTHTYTEPGLYDVMLRVRDDKGREDSCTLRVEVKGALLSVRTRVIEERADEGDTLTVIGTIENAGTTNIYNILASDDFAMIFRFPDSLMSATVTDPDLIPVPADPLPVFQAKLAPGESFEVRRRYAVLQLATYRTADMDGSEEIAVQVDTRVTEVVGINLEGDTVHITRPCDDQNGTTSGCERNHAIIGSLGANMIVNSTDDGTDQDPGDGKCSTGKMIDVNGKMVPECTLRAAIEEANAATGPQKISFKIPGSGVQTIRPTGGLPAVTEAVVIDATTQPNYKASPLIFLDGSLTNISTNGFTIDCSSFSDAKTTIKGFVIGNFTGAGRELYRDRCDR
jgi:CSLREA domain-containing protein